MVIFACGNPSRGDDALALCLVDGLAESQALQLICDFQLQIEHTLDLAQQDLALFIDADSHCLSACQLQALSPQAMPDYSSHSLHPATLLGIYQHHLKQPPPPAFLLRLRGQQFALGTGLSVQAQQTLQTARPLLQSLLTQPCVHFWRQHCNEFIYPSTSDPQTHSDRAHTAVARDSSAL